MAGTAWAGVVAGLAVEEPLPAPFADALAAHAARVRVGPGTNYDIKASQLPFGTAVKSLRTVDG